MMTNTLSALTDEQLYQKAQHYGRNAFLRYLLRKCFISRRTALRFVRVWRQKFIGLLPEVQRRRLYEKKHFGSIFEFAFKLAGLSEQQVRTTLNLEKRFSDKPSLKALLENGEVSVNKLIRIQSIATPQNEEELARAVKILPQSAVETLVRDQNGSNKPQIEAKSLHVQDLRDIQNHGQDLFHDHDQGQNQAQFLSSCRVTRHADDPLRLNEEVTKKLLDMQKKGLDVNKVLLELLNRREQEIAEEKEAISADLPTTQSRYVPVRIQRVVHEEHGDKCSIVQRTPSYCA